MIFALKICFEKSHEMQGTLFVKKAIWIKDILQKLFKQASSCIVFRNSIFDDYCYFAFLSKVRVDSGIQEGSDISIYYDPMISKVIEE